MRARPWQIDTLVVLVAGLISVAIAAPVRAQTADAAAANTSAAPEAASLEDRGTPPNLADVDIDALLDHSRTAAPKETTLSREVIDRARRLWGAAIPEDGFGVAVDWSRSIVEQAIDYADRNVPEETRRALADWIGSAVPLLEELRRSLLIALGLLVASLASLRFVRGKGDLVVSIEYPAELRGTFSVRVATSRAKATAQNRQAGRISTPEAAQRAKRNAGGGSRTERTLVSRETQFQDLTSGTWYVTIDGFLQAPDSDRVLTTHLEERETRVRRGKTVRLVVDFHPKECPIDVKVLWDRKPVGNAIVSLRGHPGSQRYARGGPVRIGVGRGPHVLVVGSGDRVAEIPIDVQSFQPHAITVDLTGRDNVLFTGCPPAVEPYLHADINGAARALEREGQTEVANLLLARLHADRGQKDVAARHFEAAERPLEAASLLREIGNHARAATLFASAGEPALAAEMFRAAGDFTAAGAAYERAARYDSALDCYREGADVENWIGALERTGAPFDAAEVAIEHDDWGRAIRSLQLVTVDDPDYAEAANLLVDAYLREGHLDLASAKIDEILRNASAEMLPLESCDTLAERLEGTGEYDRALEILELVRAQDAAWPNLATRIECLKKRISSENETPAQTGTGPAANPTDSRYEIIGEIGRGGMGVVFKARDLRLGRVVAMKRLPDNLRNHPKAIKLFLREARAAAALNHPNIVTVYDADQVGDSYYITMELLEGAPLQSILHKRGRLSARDVARLGIQVAGGLQYAHEQRVIHRDIKTGNLFFTNRKRLKIMDFGLAKMVEEVRRASTVIGGTPYYMAPEQAVGGLVDARADIYALGVTLYELLTGTVPFTEGDVTYHHRHTQPLDPRERCDEIPDAMAELVLHMLAKNIDDRCGSAARVAERLQEIAKRLD